MTDEPQRRVVLATIVVLALVALAAIAFAPPVAADSHGNDSAYVIEQGDQCIDVDPVVDESQSAEEFYDYRHPDSDPSSSTYSSYGTVAYQEDNASTLMLYHGSEGTSLVIVHERLHDPDTEGTNGSSATFVVSGLSPDDDGWVVEDDGYDGRDDNFDHSGTQSEIDWVWARGRTDGGVYRGLDGEFEIEIDPAFNEAADQRFSSPSYTGMVHDWDVVTATEDGHERTTLDSLQDSVTISPGYCAAPPTADLAAGDAEPGVGQTVTFDASGSTAETGIEEYRWDLTGDGDVDQTTQASAIEHGFDAPGEQTVTVTVVATDGQTATASTTVNVADDTAPTAAIDAPAEAVPGETVTLSGANSADDNRIASYEWAIGNGSTLTGETVQHAFETPGEYAVELTVTDPAGNEDTATTTVTVAESDGPGASLAAPQEATVGESVTLDASGSVAGTNASYEWTIDGESVATTAEPTLAHNFSAAGEHTVTVVVADDNGSDEASTTIDVAEPLAADLAATPTEATVGEPVAFDASGSTGDVVAYDWAFGDDATVENGSATAEHAYEAPGTHEATVTVHDGTGASDTATVTVDVTANESDGPTAQLDAPADASVSEPVVLDASGSEVGTNATYVWVVDGSSVGTTTEATYEHTFSAEGDHEVAVTVTDDDGVSDTAAASIAVAASDSGGGNGSDGGNGDGSGGDGSGAGDGSSGGGGGYGGGGGGGYSPPPSDDEPVETSVEIDDGAIVVTAENVEADESFTVDVPQNASIDAGTGDVLELRSLAVTPAEDADEATITVEPADRSVPGRFTATSAFEPDADLDVESITYDVSVDREAMTAAGVSADDLTVYANTEAWDPLETTAETADGRILASATVDGDAPAGIGAVGPVLYVRDVATDGATADGEASLATTVENTGTDPGDWTVPVNVTGEPAAEQSVALDAGEERTISTAVPASAAAEDGVRVAGIRRELAVAAVTELSVTPTEPAPNETATVETTVVNHGDAGEVAVALHRDGETVATQLLTLEAGEETTVAFEQTFASEGTYELAAGNATASVTVAERDSFDGEGSEVTSDATPGFGALGAIGALAIALLVRRRRGR